MRARVAVAALSAVVLVVAAAVALTAVRSHDEQTANAPAGSAVSLARVASRSTAAGPLSTVTVPGLSGSAAPGGTAEIQAQADAAQASASGVAAASSASASSVSASAAASSAGASRAAASRAKASLAAAGSAQASRAAASSAAASSSASASSAAASIAAASRAAASSAASVSAASVSAASVSAASVSAASSAAASRSAAAANPAPDTSDAVQAAVQEAAADDITQSVVVMNRQTGSITTSIDADDQVPSMSLVKLFLAADVIDSAGGVDEVDPGTLAQLHQMIIASDDSIAQQFYDDDGQGDIITRMSNRYGLAGTQPSPQARYWGDVRITAHDEASFLFQLLSDSETSTWFTEAMEGSLDQGADGFDQNFGVNSVPGAGSKQGWGCCLGSVMSIHSMGFTANQIIVVLSTADNDVSYTQLGTARQLTDDPGAQASVASVTRTVDAALPPS